ncbi:unnamed protein product [Amoebophrya sp. A120]|nr:unnamed protein product [Amoebophrya sp. A120]|eukprot:GSA120T00000843001.1
MTSSADFSSTRQRGLCRSAFLLPFLLFYYLHDITLQGATGLVLSSAGSIMRRPGDVVDDQEEPGAAGRHQGGSRAEEARDIVSQVLNLVSDESFKAGAKMEVDDEPSSVAQFATSLETLEQKLRTWGQKIHLAAVTDFRTGAPKLAVGVAVANEDLLLEEGAGVEEGTLVFKIPETGNWVQLLQILKTFLDAGVVLGLKLEGARGVLQQPRDAAEFAQVRDLVQAVGEQAKTLPSLIIRHFNFFVSDANAEKNTALWQGFFSSWTASHTEAVEGGEEAHAFPRLRELRLEHTRIDPAILRLILRADATQWLETLVLHFGYGPESLFWDGKNAAGKQVVANEVAAYLTRRTVGGAGKSTSTSAATDGQVGQLRGDYTKDLQKVGFSGFAFRGDAEVPFFVQLVNALAGAGPAAKGGAIHYNPGLVQLREVYLDRNFGTGKLSKETEVKRKGVLRSLAALLASTGDTLEVLSLESNDLGKKTLSEIAGLLSPGDEETVLSGGDDLMDNSESAAAVVEDVAVLEQRAGGGPVQSASSSEYVSHIESPAPAGALPALRVLGLGGNANCVNMEPEDLNKYGEDVDDALARLPSLRKVSLPLGSFELEAGDDDAAMDVNDSTGAFNSLREQADELIFVNSLSELFRPYS